MPEDSDASILMMPAQSAPKDGTTILEMSPIARGSAPGKDDSTLVVPISATEAFDDSTMDAPGEGPMPVLLLPGTRRATIDRQCLRHRDTPAVVLCMKCAAPICSICAEETPQGTICSGGCKKKSIPMVAVVIAAAALIAIVVVALPTQKQEAPTAALAKTALPPAPTAPLQTVEAPLPEPVKAEPPKPEPAKVEAPKVEPPKPEPPKVDVPKPEPPKAEPRKPEPPKTEAPKPEPPKAEPKPELAKVPSPPVEPPKPSVAPEVATALTEAAGLIRASAPLFREAAETVDPSVMQSGDAKVLLSKLSNVEERLVAALALYERIRNGAPDPELLDRRISRLEEILDALRMGREKIVIPRVLFEASERIREATPLCQEIAEALERRPASEYMLAALQLKSKRVIVKLTEAKSLYESVRKDASNSSQIAERIARLDDLMRSVRIQ
jgi:hypothetical protein